MNKTETKQIIEFGFGERAAATVEKVGHNRFSFIADSPHDNAVEECLLYHRTVVAGVNESGDTWLNTGGFFTVTTKATLCEVGRGGYLSRDRAPFTIYQRDHTWYVTTARGTWSWFGGTALVLRDGTVRVCDGRQVRDADGNKVSV